MHSILNKQSYPISSIRIYKSNKRQQITEPTCLKSISTGNRFNTQNFSGSLKLLMVDRRQWWSIHQFSKIYLLVHEINRTTL